MMIDYPIYILLFELDDVVISLVVKLVAVDKLVFNVVTTEVGS